jgi:uncharacterized membrane protein
MEQVMGKEIKKIASKTNRSVLKLWSLLLVFVLGVLGVLSGCDTSSDPLLVEYGVYAMYGVQTTKYIDQQLQNQNAE